METTAKYARPEWERRFLLRSFPEGAAIQRSRKIIDRYIVGTTLRLRRQVDQNGGSIYKLTQKVPTQRAGAFRGMITTIYLAEHEFEVFAALPAVQLTKTRYSVPPFGIDVFEGTLAGLILAEAEFESGAEASALTMPSFVVQEVSDDSRLEGARLATTSRGDLQAWLAEYGVVLPSA